MTPTKIIRALACYLYNTSTDQIVSDVFGEDVHDAYRAEKIRLLEHGFQGLFGFLDEKHQEKFVHAAMKKHEGE